jgi:two-component system CheB/CheR fusion protein
MYLKKSIQIIENGSRLMAKKASSKSTQKKTTRKDTSTTNKTRTKASSKKSASSTAQKSTANKKPSSKKNATSRKKTTPTSSGVLESMKKKTGPNNIYPIVGMGASAGGLQAFEEFFDAMPSKCGMSFILVAHLDPTHVSILPELIQKHTQMEVLQIKDGMKVKPNCVYVIPPNKDLSIINKTLQLFNISQPRGNNLPIDSFFCSLAKDQTNKAIGIILSGTGTDGTIGAKVIKEEMGMVMVQDEASAKFNGMPRSVIRTKIADYILPPTKMPEQLIKYTQHLSFKKDSKIFSSEAKLPDALQKIFIILRARTAHDFSLYKTNTICRRIERRMNVHQIDNISNYACLLQESEKEVDILFKELLIGVTNFFRDPKAFEALEIVLEEILKEKMEDSSFRVWVPGCSSGEEAYSIAILLQECLKNSNKKINIQIFATDIDEDAINFARTGIYSSSIFADVCREHINRYFINEQNGQYQIKKMIREMIVFAPHNIIKDPPFSNLDLLCCRNLLIYFGPELQQKLIPIFHYSLRNDGILFLGTSETIGQYTDLFSLQYKKWKIYRRKPEGQRSLLTLNFPTMNSKEDIQGTQGTEAIESNAKGDDPSTNQLIQAILQQSDIPPCAIIDGEFNILYIHGRIGNFLEPAEGKVCVNILEMARQGLKEKLLSTIRKASSSKQTAVHENIKMELNGDVTYLSLIVKPILEQSPMRDLMMVMFQKLESIESCVLSKPRRISKQADKKNVVELEKELLYTKENLQTTIEELETSNEELKSTNEELQSTNEELQSLNEELETSKEELQSLNEESTTVNAELQSKIEELSKTNDDMKNLLDNTDVAIIFLAMDSSIRRFTPKATDIIHLEKSDIGRPIDHFALKITSKINLKKEVKRVLDDLSTFENEVSTEDGSIYQLRIKPYRTIGNVIDGVVIIFQDITIIKKMEMERVKEKKKEKEKVIGYYSKIIDTLTDSIILLDSDFSVIFVNQTFYNIFKFKSKETIGKKIYDLGNKQWDLPEFRELLGKILPKQTLITDYKVKHDFEGIGEREMILNARKLDDAEIIFIAIKDGIHHR